MRPARALQEKEMELRQIHYVLEIAKQKSFSKAAKELYITQPAITKQVKAVEEELQVQLFDRDTHGVSLTKDGQKFCSYARDVENAMTRLLTAFDQSTAGERVVINIGTFLFFRQAGVWPVISDFFNQNHNVVCNLKIVENREAEDMLRAGTLDYAILKVADDGMTFPDLKYEKLFEEQLFVLMSRKNRLAGQSAIGGADLSQLKLLTGGMDSHYYNEIHNFFSNSGADFNVAFMNDSEAAAMIDMVRSDVWSIIASEKICKYFTSEEITFVPLEPRKTITTYLVSSKAPKNGVKRAFRTHILQNLT